MILVAPRFAKTSVVKVYVDAACFTAGVGSVVNKHNCSRLLEKPSRSLEAIEKRAPFIAVRAAQNE